jgi:lipoprotein-anchoring transpeptidase ErfK/SrfK
LLAGCGGNEVRRPSAGGVAGARAAVCSAGAERPLGSQRRSYVAVVRAHATAVRRPAGTTIARFGRLNVNHVPVVFWALGEVVDRSCRAAWYHVQLPLRPNGVTGYVRARDVELARVRTRIVVDLSSRRVTFYRDGRELLRATAAVGSAATPTPTGRFYVNQRLIPADPRGPFGPGAIGISAFSDVLTGWTQGGPIAIHGTNQPWSIGRAVSNGCVRLPNPVLRRLFRATPSGTPVLIRP